MEAKIQTFKGKGKHPWRWRMIAKNGETLASSEGYSTKRARDKTAEGLGAMYGIPVVKEEKA